MFGYIKIIGSSLNFDISSNLKIFDLIKNNGINYFLLEDGDYFLCLDKSGFGDPFYFFELEKELKASKFDFKLVISKDAFCSFAIGRVFDSSGFIYIIEPEVFLKKVLFFDIFPYISFKYKNVFNLPLSYIKNFSFEVKREFGEFLLSCFKKEEKEKLLNEINLLFELFYSFFWERFSFNLFNNGFEQFPFSKLFEEIFEGYYKNFHTGYEKIKSAAKISTTKIKKAETNKVKNKEKEKVEKFVFKFSGEKRFEKEDFASFKEALVYFLSVNKILFKSIDAYIVYEDGKFYRACKVEREESEKSFLFTVERLKELLIKNKTRDVNIKEIVLKIKIEEEEKKFDNLLFENEMKKTQTKNNDEKLLSSINYILSKYGKVIKTGLS